jgi:transposase
MRTKKRERIQWEQKRELEIVNLYQQGMSYPEIARTLHVSGHTISHALRKHGIHRKGRRGYRWLLQYQPAVLEQAGRLYGQGQHDEAEQLLRDALQRKQRIHPYTLRTWLTPFLP